ncbi:MAG: calcium/sodium antiporter [Lachnospiraceae bacterium]|nr:calcium/sodium antiporter [Lachnospiraceae bacterium]
MILLYIFFLLLGFIALIKGADFFVDGAAGVAKNLKVPSVIIGLTIVAMGTSAPELAVSISAALKGSNEIAVSNVIGSNIFNLLAVLGVCALVQTVPVDKKIMKRDFPFSIIVTIVLFLFVGIKAFTDGKMGDALSKLLSGKSTKSAMAENAGTAGRLCGVVLLILFVGYIVFLIAEAKKNRLQDDTEYTAMTNGKCALLILVGLALIVAGGQAVVISATKIAQHFKMSETLIGLTIVALGTSLPELVTSVVASKKGENGLAVGNVVGSCIFNILLILGASCLIHPIAVNLASVFDLILLLLISLITYIFAVTKSGISFGEGIAMILIYIADVVFAAVR